jgi:hypothetical protein
LFRIGQRGFKRHPEQRDIIYIQSIGGGVATWMITTTSSFHNVREPKLRDEVYLRGRVCSIPGCEARNREETIVCIAFMHRKSGKFSRF